MLGEFKKTRLDWILIASVLLLCAYGLFAVYSTTVNSTNTDIRDNFNRQLLWIAIGLVLGTMAAFMPMNFFHTFSYVSYFLFLILLIILDFIPRSSGAARWFEFGFIKLQPSEFMKPVLVLAFARFISDHERSINNIKTLFTAFLMILIPFALVLKQPDLGTSLTFLIIVIPMLYWQGLSPLIIFILCTPIITFIASFNYWTFFVIILMISGILYFSRRGPLIFWSVFIFNIGVGILAPMFWNKLHDYQQQRILTFLGLVSDPRGIGYQIIQSKVAIGSGGIWGKGFLQGTQTQLRFLPAQHTDFIFSVLAEEWGFIGALIVLLTFFVFLKRGIDAAASSHHRFLGLVTIGLVSMFMFQIVLNIGMTLGIMPVTGIPLPFISYGGSSMLSSMIMSGMILRSRVVRKL
jgi:rod shape determining protein RodA